MAEGEFILDGMKRKIKIEQAVRDYLHIMEMHELTLEEGLIAWNMLGFTIFQDVSPQDSHEETQRKMIEFSQQLFNSRS